MGWSQADLAHKVGVHINTIKGIETDQNEGAKETREAIAGALKCTLADLYVDHDLRRPTPIPPPPSLERLIEAAGDNLPMKDLLPVLEQFAKSPPRLRAVVLAFLFQDFEILGRYQAELQSLLPKAK